MAKIRAVLESLEEIPQALHDIYTEKEGKFLLDLEGVEEHPSTSALRNALEAQKAARKKLADEVKTLKDRLAKIPDDFDPEEVARLKAQLEEYEADPTKQKPTDKQREEAVAARKMLEQKITSLEKAHATEIDGFKKQIVTKDQFISQLLIDDGLTKALVEAGISKEFLKAAKALLREDVKVVEEDGEYRAIVETDTGPLEINRYVNDWVASDEGKPFVPQAKGGDAGGGRGTAQRQQILDKNPWTKEHWNITEQGKLFKTDRVRAEKLAKAAGKQLPAAS